MGDESFKGLVYVYTYQLGKKKKKKKGATAEEKRIRCGWNITRVLKTKKLLKTLKAVKQWLEQENSWPAQPRYTTKLQPLHCFKLKRFSSVKNPTLPPNRKLTKLYISNQTELK